MNTTTLPARSGFVSVVAWIFIVLSGFGTLIGILQNVMVAFLFPMKEMQQAIHDPKGPPVPPVAEFMFGHFQLIVATMLLVMATVLITSIGLLRRKNWARKLFIFFMALGIIWQLLGLAFQLVFFSEFPQMPPPGAPADFAGGTQTVLVVIELLSVGMALTFTLLFGWIIKRLLSKEVKEEFGVYSYE